MPYILAFQRAASFAATVLPVPLGSALDPFDIKTYVRFAHRRVSVVMAKGREMHPRQGVRLSFARAPAF